MNLDNLNFLNSKQKEAVLALNGPVRIIAGPGSGKTRTLIAKANYILEEELAFPNQILILTFTNKAANEIKKRVEENQQTLNNVFTFHSFAAYFLRVEAKKINVDPNYVILDRSDQLQILKREIKQWEAEEKITEQINPNEALERFSKYHYQNKLFEEDVEGKNRYNKLISSLYNKYLIYKKKINAFDFDDLLIKVENILKEYEEIRLHWQKKFKYIFVDEFQDTNKIQYSIIKSLTNPDSNLTVVGDPDQNIYTWRGSDLRIILNFEKDYNNVKTIILNNNYRSTKNIIKLSNNLISQNKSRVAFDVITNNQEGILPKLNRFYSKNEQAEQIVNQIMNLHYKEKIPLDEIAIIYRANYISKEFENVLARRGINYQIIGGYKFYERKEIKEMLNFLRFLILQDDHSFVNVSNFPPRGFGEKGLEKLQTLAFEQNKTLWETLISNEIKISTKLKDFVENTKEALKAIDQLNNGEKFYQLFEFYLLEISFIEYYQKDEERKENIYSLLEQLKLNFKDSLDIKTDVLNFLNTITLQSAADKGEIPNFLTLLTAHASKGTEYKAVFIPSFNERIFPSYRIDTKKEMEEERRVAYVAITRAKEKLFLSYVDGYDYNGNPMTPSRFLNEMSVDKYNLFPKKYSYNNKEIYNQEESKTLKFPPGFSVNSKDDVKSGDIVFHNKYGEGVVVSEEDRYISVAFEKGIGIKTLLKDHPSWAKKV